MIPETQGFRPIGKPFHMTRHTHLLLDEFEAVRMLDYLHMTQEEAAERMDVSRPTLTRIYERARNKIAEALVEGQSLIIGGGNVMVQPALFHCPRCLKHFDHAMKDGHCCRRCKQD
jgi:predicted DNA-binding protein (UPF0251 family)